MKGEKDLRSPDCPDGTDLICGLIKELSWLKLVPALHVPFSNLALPSRLKSNFQKLLSVTWELCLSCLIGTTLLIAVCGRC